jgi:hypothetical protein
VSFNPLRIRSTALTRESQRKSYHPSPTSARCLLGSHTGLHLVSDRPCLGYFAQGTAGLTLCARKPWRRQQIPARSDTQQQYSSSGGSSSSNRTPTHLCSMDLLHHAAAQQCFGLLSVSQSPMHLRLLHATSLQQGQLHCAYAQLINHYFRLLTSCRSKLHYASCM